MVPFWFWNGEQTPSELTRQMELAAAGGVRGLAISPRVGNQVEFLSESWMRLCKHCCDEAQRLGLEIWLYDDEGFPSGTVKGRIPREHPELRHKVLRYAYRSGSDMPQEGAHLAVCHGSSYAPEDPGGINPENEYLVFWVESVDCMRIVDSLNRASADMFIELTHARYRDALGAYFGKTVTHVYTDDLYICHHLAGEGLPWTDDIAEAFESRWGYSLVAALPHLVENLPGCAAARLHWQTLLVERFLQRYVRPMVHWCDANGLRFTGHLCGDEGPFSVAAWRLGSPMAFYAEEHTPGIDDFFCLVESGCYLDQIRNRCGKCATVVYKQASSVANQLKGGKAGVECLTYLGWGASVWGQAAALQYELALGFNIFTHHYFSYATGGVAKRDCPPSTFFQQPYWPYYRQLLDLVTRSTELLTRGRYDADVLILHPMSSCQESGAPVIVHTRRVGGEREHFVYNASERPQEIGWTGSYHVYDPASQACISGVGHSLVLPPFAGIHLLPHIPLNAMETALRQTLFAPGGRTLHLQALTDWRITLEQTNLMLIDWCEFPDGKNAYHTEVVPADAGNRLRVQVSVDEPFRISGILGEQTTLCGMSVNGHPLPAESTAHPSSPDLRIVSAKGLFFRGENVIEFNRTSPPSGFGELGDSVDNVLFEPFYIMGDFGSISGKALLPGRIMY